MTSVLEATPARPPGRLQGLPRFAAWLAALLALSAAGWGWHAWSVRSPYPATAVEGRVALTLGSFTPGHESDGSPAGVARAVALVARGSGLERLVGPGGWGGKQFVVGRLDYRVPSAAPRDGLYVLFVVDRRTGRPVSTMWGRVPAAADRVGTGWDSRYDALGHSAPWLYPLTVVAPSPPVGRPALLPGLADRRALLWRATEPGPLSFYAELDPVPSPVTDPAADVEVVLAFYAGDLERVNWVVRLPVQTVRP